MHEKFYHKAWFYNALFVVVLVPALLINLGVHHIFIHTDESLRALIALEMDLTDQFIAPTVNGEFYYNKPPLYNWIIALSFKIFGNYSLFALRFPVFVAILFYGFLIIRFLTPEKGSRFAWWVAIATITSGRILFYDSFLGLIDIAFSSLIFINFMLFYRWGKKRPYFGLFALTYFISAIAYLMKGLPPIVFQGLTILAWSFYRRNWKLIFHPMHFIGALFFLIPVGTYYYFYLEVNPQSLSTLFQTLWVESSKRTVTEYGISGMLKAIATFPFENLYHFAPWTIFIAALFRRGIWADLWNNRFIRYCFLVFCFNIVVYWTSPGVYPRYLFMFLPLFFAILFHGYQTAGERFRIGLQRFFLGVVCLAIIAPGVMYFAVDIEKVPFAIAKAFTLSAALVITAILYYRRVPFRWQLLGIYLLILRIGFDWFILPNRDTKGQELANSALKVAEITEGEDLYILGPNYCHSATAFMIERERGEVLRTTDQAEPGDYYLIYDGYYDPEVFTKYLQFGTRGTPRELILVQLK